MPNDWVDKPAAVRRECKPETAAVVIELMGKGWRVRRQGHKFRLYCPCGDGRPLVCNGTPRNDHTHAERLRRQAALCPDCHDLLPGSSRS